MKYSEIRAWIDNYLEHCGKEDIVNLYNKLGLWVELDLMIQEMDMY